MSEAISHSYPVIQPHEVSALEFKYYDFIRSMALTAHERTRLTILQGMEGRNGRLHNRYVFSQGKQHITVDFRVFTINELPSNFRHCMMLSPAHRAMISTIKSLGANDLISAVLSWLNDTIGYNFAKNSSVYYALQNKAENLHAFYYAEKDTDSKVVVQVQL